MRNNYGYCFAFILLMLVNSLSARELTGREAEQKIHGSEKIIPGIRSPIPEYIQFREETNITVEGFNAWAHDAFSLPSNYGFSLLNVEKDQIGMMHYRYQQTCSGFPVEGTMYIVHAKNDVIVSMNGMLFDHLNTAASASISESMALSKALDYMNAELYRWQIPGFEEQLKKMTDNPDATWFPKGELILAPFRGDFSSAAYRLAYRFDVYSQEPMKREYVFVDATSGEVIYTLNRIHSSNSQATAVTRYSGTRTITTDSVNATTFRLRETGRGLGIETYNILNDTLHAAGIDFTDTDNIWNNVNAQQDEVATDAHWGAEMTYDFYQTKFSRSSVNNAGKKLYSFVHYRTNFTNANWDGTEMNYGDGNQAFGYGPLTCLDVTGHEISHGVTQYTSNLFYANESGAMNESFSDCMGNSIRQFGKNNSSINWLIGDEMGGTPLRNMANPNQYGNPDTYQGNFWDFGTQEVHNNSGVMNFWFYLLTEGGNGTNDIGHSYSVTGIGIEKAAAICYRMNTMYLFPSAQYDDARTYAILAAIDLYGACTNEVQQTVNAWYAVGVGGVYSPGVYSDFVAPVRLFCTPPATVRFSNLSSNAGTLTWDFGDGSIPSHAQNPVHTYNSFGDYVVTLIADGGTCGVDTLMRIDYISVNHANPCVVTLPSAGIGTLQNACSGQLFDSGGPTGNYQDMTDVSMTIAPTGAATVTLTFSSFNFESTFDFLYIYDGPTTGSPLIGQYTGTSLPGGGTITSTTGSLTIRQTSDQALTFSGFSSMWQCTLATIPPTASFNADVTSTCTGLVQFADQSINGPAHWHWNFGDGDSSNLQNPSHTYLSNGTFTVALTVSNSFGSNVSTSLNYISVNRPPAPVANGDTICSGSPASLSASGLAVVTWYDSLTGGSVVGTGNVFNTPVLSGTKTFYAESDIYSASDYVGPADTTIGGGGIYSNGTYRGLLFDVLNPVRLVSVKVFAQGTSNRTITLIKNGITVRTAIVNIPNGESRVVLNWDFVPGTDYELGCPGQAFLYRNNSGGNYPYTLPGVVSITGNSAGNNALYYFFYDWELQDLPCKSPRTPVVVNVLPSPAASYNSFVSSDSVSFTDNSTGATGWLWNFGDPASGSANTSALQSPYHLFSSEGFHQVCLKVTGPNGCSDSTCQAFLIAGIHKDGIDVNSAISVFPNPVNDDLSIQFHASFFGKKCSLRLVDVLGKTVAEKIISVVQPAGKYDWNVSSLAPGAYMLELESENQKLMKRIIRQ